MLVTVIVQAALSPALIGLLSAVLTTWRSGPSTTTWSVSVSEPSLVVVTDAVLETGLSGTVAGVVGLVMWTVRTWPEARSPRLQVRTPRRMVQEPAAEPPLIGPAGAGVGRERVGHDDALGGARARCW